MNLVNDMQEIRKHNRFVWVSIIMCPLIALSYVLISNYFPKCPESILTWYDLIYNVSLAIFASDLFYLMQSYFPSRERLQFMDKLSKKDGTGIVNDCKKLVYIICNCDAIREKAPKNEAGEYDKDYLNAVWNHIKEIQTNESLCKLILLNVTEVKEKIREYSLRYNSSLPLENLELLRKIEDSFFMYLMPYIVDKRLKGVKETVIGSDSLYEFYVYVKELEERCKVMGEVKQKKRKKELAPYALMKREISKTYKSKKIDKNEKYLSIKAQIKAFSRTERAVYKLDWISYTAGPSITEFAGTITSLVINCFTLAAAILALDKQINIEIAKGALVIQGILCFALLVVFLIRWDGGKESEAAYILQIIGEVDAEKDILSDEMGV